jgi:predicted membrane channel-forming protein YqfA (hemolysin III family)
MQYSHALWHMFVIAGSDCRQIAMMAQVVSQR